MVSLLNSANAVVATATTDSIGFYFFAQTGSLTLGAELRGPGNWNSETVQHIDADFAGLHLVGNAG